MKTIIELLRTIADFVQEKAAEKRWRRGFYLSVLLVIALGDVLFFSPDRRTFEFFNYTSLATSLETRMVPRRPSREDRIALYVDEYLLGPVSVHQAPIFTKGTRVESLMVRKGIVWVSLSERAVLPVEGRTDISQALSLLDTGIRRNFPRTKAVVIFIDGSQVYPSMPSKGKALPNL